VIDVAFAVLGVVLMSVAVSGYFQRALGVWARIAIGVAGLVTLLPHAMTPGGIGTNGIAALIGLVALAIWGRLPKR